MAYPFWSDDSYIKQYYLRLYQKTNIIIYKYENKHFSD